MMEEELLTGGTMRSFAVFATHLNFTRAAAQLHITQPSLHAKIGKLARTLDVELYRRQGRRLELTAEGRRLAAYAQDACRRAEEYLHSSTELTARVTVAAGRASLLWVIDEALRKVVDDGALLRVVPADRTEALHLVETGEADVAVVAFDPPPAAMRSVRIATHPQVVILPTAHPLAKSRSIKVAEVAEYPLVLPPPGRPHRTAIERALRPHAAQIHIACEAEGWDLTVHLVTLGIGISVVNGCVRLPESLVAVAVSDLPTVDYWLAWRPARSAAAAVLAQHMEVR